MSVKKNTGAVRKQLYGMPQYREDQQRRGPTLPDRNVQLKLPQVKPYAKPGKAYKQILEQQAVQHQVNMASKLLGKASRIKSGPRLKDLHKKLAAVDLPTGPSLRNRPILEVEHREIVQVKRQPKTSQEPFNSELLRRTAILNCHRLVQKRQSPPKFDFPAPKHESTPKPVRDPLITHMNDLKQLWHETKAKLLNNNYSAVMWANSVRSQHPSAITNRQFNLNVHKQQQALKVIAEIDEMINSAIQSGDLEQAEDAVFTAFERVLQDEYACVGKYTFKLYSILLYINILPCLSQFFKLFFFCRRSK